MIPIKPLKFAYREYYLYTNNDYWSLSTEIVDVILN